MELRIAYLSNGRLYIKSDGVPAKLIESPFALNLLDRDARDQHRHGWKTKSGIGGMPGGSLWSFRGQPGAAASTRQIRITGVSRGGGNGELIYVLDMAHTSGLFRYDTGSGEELRLVHRKDFQAFNLCRHPVDGLIACSVPIQDGTAHISIMESDRSRLRELTEGDAVDENPSWIPGQGQRLLFQSSGLARNHAGMALTRGPAAVMKLDLDRGNLTALVEDSATDYILPSMSADGSLYFIRRPYEDRPPYTFKQMLLDMVLFPYRLLRAIFDFLNVFSIMFSGKPLTSAGGPKLDMPETRFLMLQGKLIDAQKAARAGGKGGQRSLVPASWELVRRSPEGKEEVLAKRVASYDLCSGGGLIYTDGFAVHYRAPDGATQKLCDDSVVEQVLVVADA